MSETNHGAQHRAGICKIKVIEYNVQLLILEGIRLDQARFPFEINSLHSDVCKLEMHRVAHLVQQQALHVQKRDLTLLICNVLEVVGENSSWREPRLQQVDIDYKELI